MPKWNWTTRSVAMVAAVLLTTASLAGTLQLSNIQQSAAPGFTVAPDTVTADGNFALWSNGSVNAPFMRPGEGFTMEWADGVQLGGILIENVYPASYEITVNFDGGQYVDTCTVGSYELSTFIDFSAFASFANVRSVQVAVKGGDFTNVTVLAGGILTNQSAAANVHMIKSVAGDILSGSNTDSIIDGDFWSSWIAPADQETTWVGIATAGNTFDADGIRVIAGYYGQGNVAWQGYAVQVTYDGSEWVTLLDNDGNVFRGIMDPDMIVDHGQQINWIDFGQTLTGLMGIRLYGDGETGTIANATGVSEVFAYTWAPTVPEPATMILLALGGLAMLRRRK